MGKSEAAPGSGEFIPGDVVMRQLISQGLIDPNQR